MTDSSKSSKETRMRALQQSHFVALDLGLYIDTHPDCPNAKQAFETAKAAYAQALENFHASHQPDSISGPWPWEGGAIHVEL